MIGAGKRILIIVADTPITANGGTSLVTTAPAPIMAPSWIFTPHFMVYIAANPDIRADFGIWITVKFLLDAEIVENII